jgi:hypothetical protein
MEDESPVASQLRVLIALAQLGPHGTERELARRHDALVVYQDWGGALLLRPGEEVLLVKWDFEDVAEPADLRWQMVARKWAAHGFPELRSLGPPRPPGAPDCPECGGSGSRQALRTCHTCFGYGWLGEYPTEPWWLGQQFEKRSQAELQSYAPSDLNKT